MAPEVQKTSYKGPLDTLRVSEHVTSTVVDRPFDGKSLCITHRNDGSCALFVSILKNPLDRSEGYYWIDCAFDAEGFLSSSATTFHRQVGDAWENTEVEFELDWERELQAFVLEQERQRSPEVRAQLEGRVRYILEGVRARSGRAESLGS